MNLDEDIDNIFAKVLHNLDFIKLTIDKNPDEAKKLIDEMIDDISGAFNKS